MPDQGMLPQEATAKDPVMNRKKGNSGNNVGIKQLTYGWTVNVGCVSIAIAETKNRDQDIDDMMRRIGDYLKDPEAHEKRYCEVNGDDLTF